LDIDTKPMIRYPETHPIPRKSRFSARGLRIAWRRCSLRAGHTVSHIAAFAHSGTTQPVQGGM